MYKVEELHTQPDRSMLESYLLSKWLPVLHDWQLHGTRWQGDGCAQAMKLHGAWWTRCQVQSVAHHIHLVKA